MVRHLSFGLFDDQPVVNCSVCLVIDGEKKKRSRTHLCVVLCYGYIFMLYFLLSDDFFFFFKLICFLLELLEGKKNPRGQLLIRTFFFHA